MELRGNLLVIIKKKMFQCVGFNALLFRVLD